MVRRGLKGAGGISQGLLGRATCLAAFVALVFMFSACGGGDSGNGGDGGNGSGSGPVGSLSETAIKKFVPPSSAFTLSAAIAASDSPAAEVIASTDLAGNPRVHVVADTDAVADAELIGQYSGVNIYGKASNFWAELEPSSLFVSASTEAGVHAYVDFYTTGTPALAEDRFWDAFDYWRGQLDEGLDENATLRVDYQRSWSSGAGGLRIEATEGERKVILAVLFATDTATGSFADDTLAAFKDRFAVPESAKQSENGKWDYRNLTWTADIGPEDGAAGF